MKIQKILLPMIGIGLLGSIALAQDIQVNRGRQPVYETHTHDRYIKYERSGGRGNDGTIHFMNKTTIRRRYDRRSPSRRTKQRCYKENGRRVACP